MLGDFRAPHRILWRVQESYRLLFLTAPAVSDMEESIRTLRETIAAAKETIAEREALIGKHNPRLFQTLQVWTRSNVQSNCSAVWLMSKVLKNDMLNGFPLVLG